MLYDTTIQTIFRIVESQKLKSKTNKQTKTEKKRERERERERILYALLSSKQIFPLTKLLKSRAIFGVFNKDILSPNLTFPTIKLLINKKKITSNFQFNVINAKYYQNF